MIVRGRAEDVREVFDAIRGQAGSKNELFDLNKIIEMPEAAQKTDIFAHGEALKKSDGTPDSYQSFREQMAAAQEACFEATGFLTWTDWAFDNWGTQQNVYRIKQGAENELISVARIIRSSL